MLATLQSKLIFYGLLFAGLTGGFLYVKHQFNLRDKYEASAKFEKSEKEKAIATINEQVENAKHDQNVLEVYHDAETKIQYVDRVVTKKVIEYRESVPNRIQLDDKWVLAYNESTNELHTESSSIGANDSTGTLTKIVNDADALEVATSNNRACVRTIARLRSLQEWAGIQK